MATLSSGAIRFPTLSGWWNESKLELRGLPFGELVSEPDSELSELLGRFLWPNVSVEFRGPPRSEPIELRPPSARIYLLGLRQVPWAVIFIMSSHNSYLLFYILVLNSNERDELPRFFRRLSCIRTGASVDHSRMIVNGTTDPGIGRAARLPRND